MQAQRLKTLEQWHALEDENMGYGKDKRLEINLVRRKRETVMRRQAFPGKSVNHHQRK